MGRAAELRERYLAVRARTETLAAPLTPEDQQVQSMPACSPTKWHRAHVTWFFETFVLAPRGVERWDARFGRLFNSYYQTLGEPPERAERGLWTRPDAREVGAYRRVVDGRMLEVFESLDEPALSVVELGLAHEEQHQELMLTDILHAFSRNPISPSYAPPLEGARRFPGPVVFQQFEGGLLEQGAAEGGFAFDNERPRHRVFLAPFALASRPVTWGEVRAFVEAGGYRTASLWLSDGWDVVCSEGWQAPIYASLSADGWRVFELGGHRHVSPDEPACHLSYYEADAIARFLGGRLPTEQEWEHASPPGSGLVWEWTSSAYAPYPGYRTPPGALGEYNGKFMSGQQVLRGGSSFTPPGHIRATYRNFWHPMTRFQRSGLRLAREL